MSQPKAYIEALYAQVEHWYESADRKAQIALILDGAFLSFITSQAFAEAKDLKVIHECGGLPTVLLLGLMALLLAASILSAIACLHPRLHTARGKTEALLKQETDKGPTLDPIPSRLAWFFGHIAQFDEERVANQLLKVNQSFADEALAYETAKFSRNVVRKHVWADRAFLFVGASLICLLLSVATYWPTIGSCPAAAL